ncbi:reverse transcriptase domain-containing protein [Tanacetum coccineum]
MTFGLCIDPFSHGWSDAPTHKKQHALASPQDSASGGVSDLGLWDEDNTCWTKSFPVSSSSYVKSLSGRVSMWGIAEDVLVRVVEHVYPVDFVILDIKENKKRPFILGTPFLTTAKAVIKFDKGTITLRSGKSKISFHRILESLCKDEKGIKNDIEPIAPTMTVNRLVLKWEERIKYHQEKEMEFDQ